MNKTAYIFIFVIALSITGLTDSYE